MQKKGQQSFLSVFAILLFFLGILLVVSSIIQPFPISGYAIYDLVSINVSFVNPTPVSASSLENISIGINLTSSANLSYVWLEWNGINESMSGADQNWYLTKIGIGTFAYRGYGNISNGTYSATEERTVILGNVSIVLALQNKTLEEDSVYPELDLWNATSSNKNTSELTYSIISQSNTTVLTCQFRTNRYLNCTLSQDQYGSSKITVKASYQTISANSSITLTVTPVNDQPKLLQNIPNQTLYSNETKTLHLENYFSDVENDTLNYTASNGTYLNLFFNGSSVSFSSLLSFVGQTSLSFIANDSKNITSSNLVFVNVTNSTSRETITSTNVTVPVITQGSFSIPNQNWEKNAVLNLDLSLYLPNPPENAVYNVEGTSSIATNFTGAVVTLTPVKNWFGTETATFKVIGSTITYASNPVQLTVANKNRSPVLKSQIPDVQFTDNQTKAFIDLSQYFEDPDGDPLDYVIGETEGVNATLQTKTIAILTLATIPSDVANETVQISASDPYGGTVKDDLLITIAESLRKSELQLSWILYLAIAGVVVSLLLFGFKKMQARTSLSQEGTEEVASKEVFQKESVSNVSDENWMARLYENFLTKKQRNNGQYREELYYLKQALMVLDALIASTTDKLASLALIKEKEKLSRAYNVLLEGLADENIRKEILYLREVKASLLEIRTISNDKLIREELSKEIELLNKVLKNFFQERETIIHSFKSEQAMKGFKK